MKPSDVLQAQFLLDWKRMHSASKRAQIKARDYFCEAYDVAERYSDDNRACWDDCCEIALSLAKSDEAAK